jgi:hypothetical protein
MAHKEHYKTTNQVFRKHKQPSTLFLTKTVGHKPLGGIILKERRIQKVPRLTKS